MRAGEIRRLAAGRGIGPGTSVLDLCCGVAGPGRLITAETGCRYLGLDYSASALASPASWPGPALPLRAGARSRRCPTAGSTSSCCWRRCWPSPTRGPWWARWRGVLQPGGRFAFTVEAGRPLTPAERAAMPDADTVWLVELAELVGPAQDAGLSVTWQEDCTACARRHGHALLQSFRADVGRDRPPGRDPARRRADRRATSSGCDWLGSGAGAQVRAGGRKAMNGDTHGYTRYLAAKKTVDDRALNRAGARRPAGLLPAGAPRVLEVGAGLGTMVARLLEREVLRGGEYALLDVDRRLLRDSRTWLAQWAADPRAGGRAAARRAPARRPAGSAGRGRARRLPGGRHGGPADLLIAQRLPGPGRRPRRAAAGCSGCWCPAALYWFPVTFDGESVFQPDHPCDDDVLGAYHRDDGRPRPLGRPAGERRAGRRLFGHLRAAGAPLLSAGSSDWVVHAGPDGGYPADEAYFLGLHPADDRGRPARRRPEPSADWLAVRRRQLASGELVYLAHQLDVAGRRPRRRNAEG